MSFGFSVGDFIAVGKLIADITSSLQGSSVAEYRELILELHGLQRALREIEHLPCPPGREAVTNSIKVAALMCQYPLDEFAAKLKKFESLTDAPEQTSRRATVKRIGDKVKWRFKMADEVSNLRAYLIAHVGSLNMRLMTEGLKSASMAVEETGKARMDISSGIESVSTALATTHELVIQGDILTRSNNSILIRLSKLVTRDMLPQLRQLIELTKNIWNSNLKIITILTDIQTSGPVPNLQYTWFQEPVRFEDAMGRVFPVPSEYTWGKLRAVLVEQFRNGPGYEKVLAGEFELFNSMDSTQDISGHEDSETLIPGMRITMAIIIGQYDWRGSNRCPRPGCKSTTFEPHKGGGSSCSVCNIWFDAARKPLPLPYRPDEISAHNYMPKTLTKRGADDMDYSNDSGINALHKRLRSDRSTIRIVRIHRTQLAKTPKFPNTRHSSRWQYKIQKLVSHHQEPTTTIPWTVPAQKERLLEWTVPDVAQSQYHSTASKINVLPTCPPYLNFSPSKETFFTDLKPTTDHTIYDNDPDESVKETADIEMNESKSNGEVSINSDFMCTYVFGTSFELTRRYVELQPVGMGTFGLVCKAKDILTGRHVAIKKILKPFDNPVLAKRTYRELKLLKEIQHENVITLSDIYISPLEDIYFVTELLGCDLHRVLQSQLLEKGIVQYFIYQILRGLKYVHSTGIVHRDLKPSNILINENCDLKICDFGLSRIVDPEMTGYVTTRHYRAPEIMLAWRNYNVEVDIWSAGCILAEMLRQKPIFPGRDHVHQLQIITDLLGSPSDDVIHMISSENTRKFVESLPKREPQPLSTVFEGADPLAIDLLEKMLVMDPRKRIDASQALAHPYLAPYHDPSDEPVADKKFDWGFTDADLPVDTWKIMCYSEIVDYHKLNDSD